MLHRSLLNARDRIFADQKHQVKPAAIQVVIFNLLFCWLAYEEQRAGQVAMAGHLRIAAAFGTIAVPREPRVAQQTVLVDEGLLNAVNGGIEVGGEAGIDRVRNRGDNDLDVRFVPARHFEFGRIDKTTPLTEARMRNLFQSGAAFFIVAGMCFLAAAITAVRYMVTDNDSVASSGGTVAMGVVMFILGIAVRNKNKNTK